MSVLTVIDTDCRLIEIGNVAEATGGHVCQISFCFYGFNVFCLFFLFIFKRCKSDSQRAVGAVFVTLVLMTIDLVLHCWPQ